MPPSMLFSKAVVNEYFRLIFSKPTHSRVIFFTEKPTNLGHPCESHVHSIVSNRFSSHDRFIFDTEKRIWVKQRSPRSVTRKSCLPFVFLHRSKVFTINVALFTRHNMRAGTKHFRLLGTWKTFITFVVFTQRQG